MGYAPKNPEILRCPVCRREASIPGGTVLGFKTNLRQMKLLQMVKLRGEHQEGNVQCVGCAELAKLVNLVYCKHVIVIYHFNMTLQIPMLSHIIQHITTYFDII